MWTLGALPGQVTGGGTWGTWRSLPEQLPVPGTGFIVLHCGSAEPRPPGEGSGPLSGAVRVLTKETLPLALGELVTPLARTLWWPLAYPPAKAKDPQTYVPTQCFCLVSDFVLRSPGWPETQCI